MVWTATVELSSSFTLGAPYPAWPLHLIPTAAEKNAMPQPQVATTVSGQMKKI